MEADNNDEEVRSEVEKFASSFGGASQGALDSLYASRLTAVEIYGTKDYRLDDASLASLLDALSTSQLYVRSIILKHHRITSADAIVTKVIRNENRPEDRQLSYLDLENNDIDFKGIELLINCFGDANSGLETVNLSCNPLTTDAALLISDVVSTNNSPKLLHLLVANCSFTLKGVVALTTSLDRNLEALVIDRPIVGSLQEEHTDHFSRMLSAHSTLKEVSLKYNKIQDKGATMIAQALTMNTSLSLLNLESNAISIAGAEAISSYLMKVDRLSSLFLSYNAIFAEGAIALAQALEKNKSLNDLLLKTCSIGPRGLIAIADAMNQNNTMQNLHLFGNDFDDASCRKYGRLIADRFPYVGVQVDIEVYAVDGVHHVALIET
jgi:Ran GTPase-activating protein (RanGAP) involved in mRNA processing and transport